MLGMPEDGARRAPLHPPVAPANDDAASSASGISSQAPPGGARLRRGSQRRAVCVTARLRWLTLAGPDADASGPKQLQLSVFDKASGEELLSSPPETAKLVDRDPATDTASYQLDLSGSAFTLTAAANARNKLRPPVALAFELAEYDVLAQRFRVLRRSEAVFDEIAAEQGVRRGKIALGDAAALTMDVSFAVSAPSTGAEPPSTPADRQRRGSYARSVSELSADPPGGLGLPPPYPVRELWSAPSPLPEAPASAEGAEETEHAQRMSTLEAELSQQQEYARALGEETRRLLAASRAPPPLPRGAPPPQRAAAADAHADPRGATGSEVTGQSRIQCDCSVQ